MERYEKYRDSGIEWIGEIPEHWDVKAFKTCMTINNGQDYKHVQADHGYPVMGSGGQFAYASKYMYDGEVVLLGRKGTIDKPMYYNGPFWTVDTMFFAVPKMNCCCRYMYYLALTFPFDYYATATALPSMTQSDLGNNPVAVPNYDEQQSIANYLDSKCSKIDHVIATQQKRVELLKELKQSIITRAVTRGINPNVKMKDSGVNCIGMIPEHMEITQLKHIICGMQDGTHGTYERVISPYYLLSAKNVFEDGIHISENESSISEQDYKSIVSNGYPQKGDIAICCVGTIGRCCIYDEKDVFAFQRSVTFLRTNKYVSNEFLLYALRSQSSIEQIMQLAKTSAQSGIYMGALATIKIVIPSISEQNEIVCYIKQKSIRIDTSISHALRQIDLMKEYKRSLITEVVTGKRKVV